MSELPPLIPELLLLGFQDYERTGTEERYYEIMTRRGIIEFVEIFVIDRGGKRNVSRFHFSCKPHFSNDIERMLEFVSTRLEELKQ